MTKQQKTDNLIMKTLLDIKEDVGSVKRGVSDIREDIAAYKLETSDKFKGLEKRVNKLEDTTAGNKKQIAIFVSVITAAWALASEWIKSKLGII